MTKKDDDLLDAYRKYMAGTDEPAAIFVLTEDGKCPGCKADWIGTKPRCEFCGWPGKKGSDDV